MKTRQEIKSALAVAVAEKRHFTKLRIEFKAQYGGDKTGYSAFWADCSSAKDRARHIGLAYAFLRGRRYWHTERHTEHTPSAYAIASYAEVDLGLVEAWLAEEPTAEERKAWASHVVDVTHAEWLARRARHAEWKAKRAA